LIAAAPPASITVTCSNRAIIALNSLGGDLQIEAKPAGAVVLRELLHSENGRHNPKHALEGCPRTSSLTILESVNPNCRG
jgi:hypothetical protein